MPFAAPQRPPTSRVVHALPVRKLQRHLQGGTQMPTCTAPGESRLSSGQPLAARVVLKGLRLLPAVS